MREFIAVFENNVANVVIIMSRYIFQINVSEISIFQ